MPVIINDFEVVALPPPAQPEVPRRQPQAEEAAPPPPPRPEDLERIVRRFAQRRLRLWAD